MLPYQVAAHFHRFNDWQFSSLNQDSQLVSKLWKARLVPIACGSASTRIALWLESLPQAIGTSLAPLLRDVLRNRPRLAGAEDARVASLDLKLPKVDGLEVLRQV